MEKNHLKGRGNSDYRARISGGDKGRGNASGSIGYADFKRNIQNRAKGKEDELDAEHRKAFGFGRSVRENAHPQKKTENLGGETHGRASLQGDANNNRWGSDHRGVETHGRASFRGGFRDNNERRNDKFHSNRRYNGVETEHAPSSRRNPAQNNGELANGNFTNFKKKTKKNTNHVQPTYDKSHFVDYSKPMRLNRFLANAGVCSRREADEYIQAGVVSINGNIITELGSRVVPETDKVMFHDQQVSIERRVYILLNKPKDYVTTSEDLHAKKKVLDLVKGACSERIYPVGRLDRNTTGVLLLTNDGELTSKLTHPSFNKKKVYQVTLDKEVADEDVQKITSGITLEDGDIKVDEFSFIKEGDRKNVGVEIHSGRNRIVRRIFESLGYRVMRLDRVYFAGLTKKNLQRGKWRFLSEKEVIYLKMNANNPTENC